MPQRATSRGLAYGGVALVLLSAALIVGPALWGRQEFAKQLVADNTMLGRVSKSASDVRDVVDALYKVLGAERGYLLTGSKEARDTYRTRVQEMREAIANLNASADSGSWLRFDALIDERMADFARGVALQDAGRHEEAVVASNIGTERDLVSEINDIRRQRVSALRNRYLDIVNDIRTANDRSDDFARIMFGLAGASFTLGCIGLVVYLRRHLSAEATLRSGRDAAVQASVLKTQFVATVSHDLRQPLHAISMFVGVLRRRSHDPAILAVVENVATAVASMQRMFAALLDTARLDADAIEIEHRSVPLQEMLSALEVEFTASAAAKKLSLQILPTSFSVATDPALLETILRNLLSNAVKFTDHGWVGVTTQRRGPVVDIIVFDTGVGIAAEDHPKIFGQFERLAQPGSSREGLGLGLAIVKRMVDLLGVTLTLKSQPGNGSQFTLSLPFADLKPAAERDPAAPKPEELRGCRILVLDDHREARKAIALAIETLGALPLEAASPDAAHSLLAAMAPETPHAAVVDHDLGGGRTGPDFLDAYAIRNGQALPAVIITGSTDAPTLASLAAGGRPWLIKPVDLDVLGLTLSRLIEAAAYPVLRT